MGKNVALPGRVPRKVGEHVKERAAQRRVQKAIVEETGQNVRQNGASHRERASVVRVVGGGGWDGGAVETLEHEKRREGHVRVGATKTDKQGVKRLGAQKQTLPEGHGHEGAVGAGKEKMPHGEAKHGAPGSEHRVHVRHEGLQGVLVEACE